MVEPFSWGRGESRREGREVVGSSQNHFERELKKAIFTFEAELSSSLFLPKLILMPPLALKRLSRD